MNCSLTQRIWKDIFRRRRMTVCFLLTTACSILLLQLSVCQLPCAVTQIFLQDRGQCCVEGTPNGDAYSARGEGEKPQPSNILSERGAKVPLLKQMDDKEIMKLKRETQSKSKKSQAKPSYVSSSQVGADSSNQNSPSNSQGDMKIILFWVHFFGRWDYEFGLGHVPFLDNKCPVSNCMTTQDKSLLSKASAVVFHMRNTRHDTPLPSPRFPNQSYVFFLQESPYNQWNNLALFKGIFNVTMTYRRDSDVPLPYGSINETPSSSLTDGELKALVKGKTNLVAWFVSNCGPTHSRREEYVQELQRYIPVDIYGNCGPLSCPEKDVAQGNARMDPDCYSMVERKYKFYLSFENTVCKDYVTEKVFNILEKYVVPVVYGGANYSEILPPHSVIDILHFRSPKHLAEYLKELAGNDVMYMQYFRWKMQYTAFSSFRARRQGFCKLCEMLHEEKRSRKVYNNLDKWWDKEGSCDMDMPRKLRETYESKNAK